MTIFSGLANTGNGIFGRKILESRHEESQGEGEETWGGVNAFLPNNTFSFCLSNKFRLKRFGATNLKKNYQNNCDELKKKKINLT